MEEINKLGNKIPKGVKMSLAASNFLEGTRNIISEINN